MVYIKRQNTHFICANCWTFYTCFLCYFDFRDQFLILFRQKRFFSKLCLICLCIYFVYSFHNYTGVKKQGILQLFWFISPSHILNELHALHSKVSCITIWSCLPSRSAVNNWQPTVKCLCFYQLLSTQCTSPLSQVNKYKHNHVHHHQVYSESSSGAVSKKGDIIIGCISISIPSYNDICMCVCVCE